MTRKAIQFIRKGRVVELGDVGPTTTLLDHLRLAEGSVGTKEGCNEGDCGACTVALGRVRDGRLAYEPVNACIQLLGMVDGAEVVTVEDLADGGSLHPVQRAMVDLHGSQCGFCTPGFVMSLFTLYQSGVAADRDTVCDWIAGNLCRCTGYRPIVEAALASCAGAPADGFAARATETAARLNALADGADLIVGDATRFFAAPASLDALCRLLAEHPDATIVAGATDVGLWVTKQLRDLPKIVWLGRVAGLDAIDETETGIRIGAAATYDAAAAAVAAIDPDLGNLWRRIGSKQVRVSGTVGGNIANGSPIGDTPPALIALGATLELRHGDTVRRLPLEDFFLAYGRQDRAPGEVVVAVEVPRLGPADVFRCYKISKRFDQDISAVMAAIRLTLDGDRIAAARVAFGGMAGVPKRATAAEAVLAGARLGDQALPRSVRAALAEDFQPLDDMRASAAYRLDVAGSLVEKALIEVAGTPTSATRVFGLREAAVAPAA
ncbi:xanthine dehydrogenase small subunit [Pseudoxanthobacter sp. M-2]|uniref:xanthine dehydrogenase small subunit n=1 Tax=Pseudoxanthobacter sp. M-2 TaxID=3078754 RepID=UPI0038FCB419